MGCGEEEEIFSKYKMGGVDGESLVFSERQARMQSMSCQKKVLFFFSVLVFVSSYLWLQIKMLHQRSELLPSSYSFFTLDQIGKWKDLDKLYLSSLFF